MNIKIILTVFFLGILLVSCSQEEKWPEEFKVEYVESCTLSYIESFEASLGDLMSEVNKEKLDELAENSCSCMYESMKTIYDSSEDVSSRDSDDVANEVIANSLHCEATDAQIDDLLTK